MTVSSWPGIKIPYLGVTWSDKLLHGMQYAVLAFLVAGGWYRSGPEGATGRRGTKIMILLILFCALDELHQLWIPRREASFLDWVADSIGVVAGFAAGMFVWRPKRAAES